MSATAKLCECGCGQPTRPSPGKQRGYARGEPQRFILGHVSKARRLDIPTRFWRFVDKSQDCWLWTGHLNQTGYGIFTLYREHRTAFAHRMAYELTYGPFDRTLSVCHHCDNPPCVNPSHLFLGTHAENMADGKAKSRWPRGVKHHMAKLTPDSVREIRRLRADGTYVKAIAQRFGVNEASVRQVLSGQTWSHVS